MLPDALLALAFSLLDVASWLTGAKLVCCSWRKIHVPLVALELPAKAPSLECVCGTLVPSVLKSLVLKRANFRNLSSLSFLSNLTSLDISCDAKDVDQTLMDSLGQALAPLTDLRWFGLDVEEDLLEDRLRDFLVCPRSRKRSCGAYTSREPV